MPPIYAMLKPVSGACNMHCDYCFYQDEMQFRATAVHPPMSLATLENTVRRLLAYADGSLTLAFQGGEPTLAGAAFYEELLRLERRYNTRGIPITHALQTNGYSLSEDLLAVLKKGDFLLGVSLDGTRALHDAHRPDPAGQGTFDRAAASISRLQAVGIPVNILCVVDDHTSEHAEEVLRALRPFGFLQFIPCLDPLAGSDGQPRLSAEHFGRFLIAAWKEYAALARSGKPLSIRAFDNWTGMLRGFPPENCGFCGRCAPNLVIESDGGVYPCDFYATDEWHLGNINDHSLRKMLASPVMTRFLSRAAPVPQVCRACPYFALCRNGCYRDRESVAGDAPTNRLCKGYRMFFDACGEDMARLSQAMGR